MKRYGYSEELSTGSISAGSCLASLIPPSLSLITYGLCAETSIGQLFIGGIFTGIVLMLLFIVTIQIVCIIKPSLAPERAARTTLGEKMKALRKGGFIEIVLVFAIAMGGMFAGWFTPTEAGAVGFFGMLVVTILFKRFKKQVLFRSLRNTLVMTGFVYVMLACAKMMGTMFTVSKIPTVLAAYVAGLDISKFWVILVLTLIYLVLGCFIDGVPLLLLTTPVFLPIIQGLGFNSVWFGCYMVVIIGLGGITPPVGAQCYVTAGTTKAPLVTVFKGSLPFIGAYVACALLMAVIPGIATWLPSIMNG
jgi:tripartite ATP-independent transporter DctM subunit